MEVIVKDEDRRQLLKAHNDLRNMITTIHECSDIWLSDIGKLEHLQHMLHHALSSPHLLTATVTKCGIVTMSMKKRYLSMTRLYQLVMDSAKNLLFNIPDETPDT